MKKNSNSVFIIAEAGVNHNGDPGMAFKLIDVAANAGVDAIKFQTFSPSRLLTLAAPKADYQVTDPHSTESQFDMLSKLTLSYELHYDLKSHSEKYGLKFISTAFDLESLEFLNEELRLEILKIPSGELTNGPLLLEFSKAGKPLILSTGMANIVEIREALSVLAFGFLGGDTPSKENFDCAFKSDEGQDVLQRMVTLLHCTSVYPSPLKDINLRALTTLQNVFDMRVGYSDHSKGILVPPAATALGAVVIEKHFTLDRSLPGPDHSASLEPDELKQMVEMIRSVELVLGDGEKIPRGDEIKNRPIVRKSLVADKGIKAGTMFTIENVAAKRPGTGRSPMDYWSLIGSVSNRDYSVDEAL